MKERAIKCSIPDGSMGAILRAQALHGEHLPGLEYCDKDNQGNTVMMDDVYHMINERAIHGDPPRMKTGTTAVNPSQGATNLFPQGAFGLFSRLSNNFYTCGNSNIFAQGATNLFAPGASNLSFRASTPLFAQGATGLQRIHISSFKMSIITSLRMAVVPPLVWLQTFSGSLTPVTFLPRGPVYPPLVALQTSSLRGSLTSLLRPLLNQLLFSGKWNHSSLASREKRAFGILWFEAYRLRTRWSCIIPEVILTPLGFRVSHKSADKLSYSTYTTIILYISF